MVSIRQTGLFLAKLSGQRLQSNGLSLLFGSDQSYELMINATIHKDLGQGEGAEIRCNIRFNGSAEYYQTKVTRNPDGSSTGTNPLLDLSLDQYEVLSSQIQVPYPVPSSMPSADSFCSEYAQGIRNKKQLELSVEEYDADHLVASLENSLDVLKPGYTEYYNAEGGSNRLYAFDEVGPLGLGALETTFVRAGKTIDITAEFLKTYSDSSYRVEYPESGDVTLQLNAARKELTVEDAPCGLKYIIDIESIRHDGTAPLLKGQVVLGIAPPPPTAPVTPPAPNYGANQLSCTDVRAMLDGVATAGIQIQGENNICSDRSCKSSEMTAELRIGKPGSFDPNSHFAMGALDQVLLSFKSSAHVMR